MTALAYLWKKHKGALIALVLALAVALFFAIKLVMQWIYWSDPAHRDQVIEGWMSPGYVSHSYDVPHEVIRSALPAGFEHGRRLSLDRIAEESDKDVKAIIDDLYTAIQAERAKGD